MTATGKEEERELVLLRRELADVEAWAAHLGAENEFLRAQLSALESEPAPAPQPQQLPQRALQPNGSAVLCDKTGEDSRCSNSVPTLYINVGNIAGPPP